MSHYFTQPQGPETRRTIRVDLWGEVSIETANGVFSGDGLDLGTAVLLRECRPLPRSRRFLDLGCGWGPIALALARSVSSGRVTAVDVNPRALALTADNARRLGLAERVAVLSPEAVDPAERYDEIWSNPPIRVGKLALHELLLTWLPRLEEDGLARLVVGKNLGADSLQAWLVAQGWFCERSASAKGYRVLTVARGPDAA